MSVESDEIGGYLSELPGIEHDIENMVHLFHDELGFDVYPSEYLDDIKNAFSVKQHWTETELNNFLVERAKYLANNINNNKKYDGLIVVISSHGIPGYICTSDFKTFSKIAIHRIFSSAHPKSRIIPSLFIFDCCSGNNEQELAYDRSQSSHSNDISKQISLNNVANVGIEAQP